MSIRVAMHHKTVYQYDRLVTLSPQTVRLRPAAHSRTAIQSYALTVEPKDHFINWQQDPQGNFLARLTFPNPTRMFSLAGFMFLSRSRQSTGETLSASTKAPARAKA